MWLDCCPDDRSRLFRRARAAPRRPEGRPLSFRVLLICDRLDLAGGVERFVCTLADHLAGQGAEVAVGTVATVRGEIHYPLADSVTVLQGDGELGDAASVWSRLRKQWRVGRSLARLAQVRAPDVVVLNGLTTACSVLLCLQLTAPRLLSRVICCDHNHFFARSRLWQGMRARLYPRVAAVVSLTEADAPRFAAINPATVVIPNASSLSATVPALPAVPLVLAVARHVAQKGLDLLLQAWPAVLAAVPEARLRIVGDGPLTAALRQQALALGVESSVEWLPPTGQIDAHYREAAVFVLPSRYEGMPLALLEAQALGVPAVAFDCPTGPAEILSPQTGFIVHPGDTAALADALARLLLDPALRSRMGSAAMARSRSHFSPEKRDQRWLALLQRVAAQSPQGVQGAAR
jgi:glycosyltransferase involved in cell wall biosynthesis